jgi:tRNA-specific 2-thiouridylase
MRVVAAMSGGVDSSVAAYLLKEKGYEVIGVTIKTWPEEDCLRSGDRLCCSLESINLARSVAEDLNIPHYVLDLSGIFEKEVRSYFIREYKKGRTPNPCVYCNSRIKFGELMSKARQLGAEKIATGHYADITGRKGYPLIKEGLDKKKDQSYFLFDIGQKVLESVIFPLGGLDKKNVRETAMLKGFLNFSKKSSQDICFAGADGGYKEILSETLGDEEKNGNILDMNGDVIGKHRGIYYYTIGQRKGLGVYAEKPLYVTEIDPEHNTITVGTREDALKSSILIKELKWMKPYCIQKDLGLTVRIRYNSPKVPCSIESRENGTVLIAFEEPQFAPAPGQAAVLYDRDIVAGGGWIDKALA